MDALEAATAALTAAVRIGDAAVQVATTVDEQQRKRRRIVGQLRVCGTAIEEFECPLMIPDSGPIDARDVARLVVAAHGDNLGPDLAQIGAKSFRNPHCPRLVVRVDELRVPTAEEREAYGMPPTAVVDVVDAVRRCVITF